MTVRLKSLLILGFIIFLYGIYYWGIPAVVDVSSRVELIKSLSQKVGYKIELVNPKLKMGLRPSVIVSADSFALLNDDKSKALEVKSPYVKIAILPLLFKRIDVRDFTADKIVAQIYYDKNIKIGQYPINFDVKTAMKLAHAKAKLNEYRFDMQDLNNGKRLSLVGQYLDLDSNGVIDLSSLKEKILTLPDDTKVLSGHGPDTTIGREKAENPYLNGEFY